jgi:hypothetical protein
MPIRLQMLNLDWMWRKIWIIKLHSRVDILSTSIKIERDSSIAVKLRTKVGIFQRWKRLLAQFKQPRFIK